MRVRKRKVWWIAGALVVLTAAFALTAFLVTAKDRRTDQALEELVLEYGFIDMTTHEKVDVTIYLAPLTSEQQGEDVLRRIEEICSGWDVQVIEKAPTWDYMSPAYIFTARGSGRRILRVAFQADSRGPSQVANGTLPEMQLDIYEDSEKDGIVEWLKNLLPW